MSIRHRHLPKLEPNPGPRCPGGIAHGQSGGRMRGTWFRDVLTGSSWKAERFLARPIGARWLERAREGAYLASESTSLKQSDDHHGYGVEVTDRPAESRIVFIHRIIRGFTSSDALSKPSPGCGTVNQGGGRHVPHYAVRPSPDGVVQTCTAFDRRSSMPPGGQCWKTMLRATQSDKTRLATLTKQELGTRRSQVRKGDHARLTSTTFQRCLLWIFRWIRRCGATRRGSQHGGASP